jgi:DNA-binding CsgD family transcriptional regulator
VLRGRTQECELLDRLLDDVRAGAGAALVIRGEPGAGKSTLLRYTADQAAGFRVAEIAGVESEMELPYSALHQLCAPMLGQLAVIPEPQQVALRVAFGVASGNPPDRFLVGLATLGLLAQVAEEQPLVCLVDDAQWLDGTSVQVLGFVARRLLAESVAVVFAVRKPSDPSTLAGLPELMLAGLPDEHARALLESVVPGRLDERVRDRIVAETGGNPLALLELPRGMGSAELAGGFAVPAVGELRGQIEAHFARRIGGLPEATQRLMLLAAADPGGDATLVWRAAETLGIQMDAAEPAASEQLLDIDARVRFRHPLVRSAVYRSASTDERRVAHEALATATDPEIDPDRRVWHRAHAAAGPDEEVAGELERSSGRAQARGGLAAAAAFLERSARLTLDPRRRFERTIAAAEIHLQAGSLDDALGLLAGAESRRIDEFAQARVDLLRGRIASAASAGRQAPVQLVKAAYRLEPFDRALARATYLDAWGAALFAGDLADPGGGLFDVSRAARAAQETSNPAEPSELLLAGLTTLILEGRVAAAPMLVGAVRAFRERVVPVGHWLQWGVLVSSSAVSLWDFDSWDAVSSHQIEVARGAGALSLLSVALNGQAMIATWCGDFDAATALSSEDEALKQAAGIKIAPYGALLLTAYRGLAEDAAVLAATTIEDSAARGEGLGIRLAQWTTAILNNGLGRYDEALSAAEQASSESAGPFISAWALVELIEAAARTGNARAASEAFSRLTRTTNVGGSDWAAGIEARSRALLGVHDAAEQLYLDAIERLGLTRLRPELARAHLLYGEWLRREGRGVDARQQLRVASDMFTAMGADGFTARARLELLSVGARVPKARPDVRLELTPQEEHIARLARDGRSNPEIGAELYLSARTVEWHLRKVFTKLGISSRKGLRDALPASERTAASV